jgi:hypothetical protein
MIRPMFVDLHHMTNCSANKGAFVYCEHRVHAGVSGSAKLVLVVTSLALQVELCVLAAISKWSSLLLYVAGATSPTLEVAMAISVPSYSKT